MKREIFDDMLQSLKHNTVIGLTTADGEYIEGRYISSIHDSSITVITKDLSSYVLTYSYVKEVKVLNSGKVYQ